MELCDKFLHDCIKLNPCMNDVFRLKEYEHLRHVMTDSFSDKEKDKFRGMKTGKPSSYVN